MDATAAATAAGTAWSNKVGDTENNPLRGSDNIKMRVKAAQASSNDAKEKKKKRKSKRREIVTKSF